MTRLLLGLVWIHVAIYGASFVRPSLGEELAQVFLVTNFAFGGLLFLLGVLTVIRGNR